MRSREVEARNGARSRRAGPIRFKPVPRQGDRTSDRGRNPRKPKPVQRSTPVRDSQSRTRRRPNVRRIRTRDRIDMTERKRNALDDVAAFRVVSVRDLVEHRFGGNAFSARKGIDALMAIAQMPPGVPVGCMAVGNWGARNAGFMAASILGLKHEDIGKAYEEYRRKQREG